MSKYSIGIDCGTLSARALLVNLENGEECAEAVYEYPHAVMSEKFLDGTALPTDFALQHPRDYLEALEYTIPTVLKTAGVSVGNILVGGGIAEKNPMLMQIYADVTERELRLVGTKQAGALGSAIHGAVAGGAFSSVKEAASVMAKISDTVYRPIPENVARYRTIYEEYKTLHDYFGRGANDVMKRLKAMKTKA